MRPGAAGCRIAGPDGNLLIPQQIRAVESFFEMFSDLPALGVDAGTLAAGVGAPSAPVLGALGGALNSPHSSIDPAGAANVEHLASVFRGVLADAARDGGGPLSQAAVDRLALETVLTDAFMKGRSAVDLAGASTAPTNFGRTGGAIFDGIKTHLKGAVAAEGPMSEAVRHMVEAWIDRGAVPASKSAVWLEAEAAGLAGDQASDLASVWKYRILVPGRSVAAQEFLLGTWLHGIPAFEQVAAAVLSAGFDAAVCPEIMETVLGHHMAGFVASGFSKGGLCVDFDALERAGQIPGGAGSRLQALYDSATDLAGKWRPLIDKAASQGRGLAAEQRAEYAAAARHLRDAIAAMPPEGRSQLLNDDAMQFTDLGMPKWLAMGRAFYGLHGGISNAELLQAVYGKMVQPYLEENLARGSGEAFLAGTAPVAERLGMSLDPDAMVYRPALPGQSAYDTLASSLAADAVLASAARREFGKAATRVPAEARVRWFYGQPADLDALARLAGRHRR